MGVAEREAWEMPIGKVYAFIHAIYTAHDIETKYVFGDAEETKALMSEFDDITSLYGRREDCN